MKVLLLLGAIIRLLYKVESIGALPVFKKDITSFELHYFESTLHAKMATKMSFNYAFA